MVQLTTLTSIISMTTLGLLLCPFAIHGCHVSSGTEKTTLSSGYYPLNELNIPNGKEFGQSGDPTLAAYFYQYGSKIQGHVDISTNVRGNSHGGIVFKFEQTTGYPLYISAALHENNCTLESLSTSDMIKSASWAYTRTFVHADN